MKRRHEIREQYMDFVQIMLQVQSLGSFCPEQRSRFRSFWTQLHVGGTMAYDGIGAHCGVDTDSLS